MEMLQPNAACPGQHSQQDPRELSAFSPRSLSWALRTAWNALALGLGSEENHWAGLVASPPLKPGYLWTAQPACWGHCSGCTCPGLVKPALLGKIRWLPH